jgi:hypothetical protein
VRFVLLILAVALCLLLKAALAETIDGHDGHDPAFVAHDLKPRLPSGLFAASR